MIFTEGNLVIDIPAAIGGRKFDGADHGLSHCMKAVDFVVELADEYLYIEVKDPQHPDAAQERRDTFLRSFQSGKIDNDLKYKYRDSFLYEWAAGRADKPVDYLVLIALDTLDEAQLLRRQEELRRNLPLVGPEDRAWRRPIARGCGVFNLDSWNRRFPEYPVNRAAAAG